MSNVLIIDNEARMRATLLRLFSDHGHQAVAVPNGVDAARVMSQDLPNLILIDLDVPAGGIKTAGIIRLNPRYAQIPILLGIPTGNHTLKMCSRGDLSGVLIRPYKSEKLLERVKFCLDRVKKVSKKQDVSSRSNGSLLSRKPTEAERAMEVRRQIRELTDLPTLSLAQQQVIAIMSKEDNDVDMDALIETIQSDQALTMRVMQIARSAHYGFTGSFVQTAVTFLGISKIRQIVQSATILEVFKNTAESDGGLDRKKMWEHSVACGLVMQRMCRDDRKARHFTVGLLHDVGKIVLDFKFPEYMQEIMSIVQKTNHAMHLVEQDLLGITHAEVGHELVKCWQLPNELAESILHHHAPSKASRHQLLSTQVYLADMAVRKMGIGDSGNLEKPFVQDPYVKKIPVSMDPVISKRDEILKEVEAIIG